MLDTRSRPKKSVEALRKLLRHSAPRNVVRALIKMHPADMADLFTVLSPIERNRLVDLLFQAHRAGMTLSELPPNILEQVLKDVDDARLARILTRLPVDDLVFLYEFIDEERQHAVLTQLPAEKQEEINRILRYPPDSAGRNANNQYLAFQEDETVGDVTHQLRSDANVAELLSYLYVVDERNRLTGVLSLRSLITSKDETQLKDIMTSEVISVHANEDQEEVARVVARYNLVGVPVIDDEGGMLGVVTVDDVIDILEEEFTEDLYNMAGLAEGDRVFTPVSSSLGKRLPWMTLNLFTAFVVASVVGVFQETITKLSILAVFMPVVAGLGGNTATQTLTVVTRALAIGELDMSNAAKAIAKQVAVGLGIGAVIGLLGMGVSYMWTGNVVLGVIMYAAMIINMLVAGFLGAAVPLLLKRLKLDPAIGSSVMITATTDMTGFFTFLGLATLALPYLT